MTTQAIAPGVLGEERLEAGQVVVAEAHREVANGLRDAGRHRRVPMNQSSTEKNGWSAQMATRSRPVAARASRTAAVVTSEPFLANFTISAAAQVEQRLGGLELQDRRADEVGAAAPWPASAASTPPGGRARA